MTALAATDPLPPISGMALIEGRDFLIVVDTKADSDAVRCGVVSVGEAGGYSFTPLAVAWPGERSNDLESASPIPGRPGEFLVAESGAWVDRASGAKHAGRIFHLKLSHAAGGWEAQVLGTLPLSPNFVEVEGMACLGQQEKPAARDESAYRSSLPPLPGSAEAVAAEAAAAQSNPATPQRKPEYWLLALGTRGGSYPYEPATLYWGYADIDAGVWMSENMDNQRIPISPMHDAVSPWMRAVSDFYVDPSGALWVSSTVDPGDSGPFDSYIFRYGVLDPSNDYSPLDTGYSSYSSTGWTVCGLKVEALAAPVIAGSVLSFATDDESYGGVWRPLGPQ